MAVLVVISILAAASTLLFNAISISRLVKKQKAQRVEDARLAEMRMRQEIDAVIKIQTAYRTHRTYKMKLAGFEFQIQSSSK
jgi:type II secretory pathway pseudopilin PulG